MSYFETFLKAMAVSVVVTPTICWLEDFLLSFEFVHVVVVADGRMTPACLNHLSDWLSYYTQDSFMVWILHVLQWGSNIAISIRSSNKKPNHNCSPVLLSVSQNDQLIQMLIDASLKTPISYFNSDRYRLTGQHFCEPCLSCLFKIRLGQTFLTNYL